MKKIGILATMAVAASLATAAHADVKVVQTMTIDNPQIKAAMQNMSPEQRAQMSKMGLGGSITSTIYVSGKKTRTDFGEFGSILIDQKAGKRTMLNRAARTFSSQPFKASSGKAEHDAQGSIKPTGKTMTILGHLCRDYRVSVINAAGPGSKMSGDIWAAADLPSPGTPPVSNGLNANLQSQWSKVAGMPLRMTIAITGAPMGNTVVHIAAKSISKTPIPASVFKIPADYKPGPAYANPMMGGGMGR